MKARIKAAGLAQIDGKLRANERLTLEDGVTLFNSPDLLAVGALANREREKRHGARTYFNYNLRLEPTNVCVASCLFCSFARLQPSDAAAYTMSLEQACGKATVLVAAFGFGLVAAKKDMASGDRHTDGGRDLSLGIGHLGVRPSKIATARAVVAPGRIAVEKMS